MLRLGMASLIGVVSIGVLGYGGGTPGTGNGLPALALICLTLAILGFLGGSLPRGTRSRASDLSDCVRHLKSGPDLPETRLPVFSPDQRRQE